jgi:hypothetical protein
MQTSVPIVTSGIQLKQPHKKDPNNLIDLDDDEQEYHSHGFQIIHEDGGNMYGNAYQELLDLNLNSYNSAQSYNYPTHSIQTSSELPMSLSDSMTNSNYLAMFQQQQQGPDSMNASFSYAPLSNSFNSESSNPFAQPIASDTIYSAPNTDLVLDPFAQQTIIENVIASPMSLLLNSTDGKGIEICGHCENN